MLNRSKVEKPVTSESFIQRWLHRIVSGMCGRTNSCSYERHGIIKQKQKYKSQKSAAKAATKLRHKWGRPLDVYQCWFCQDFHIGNAHDLTFRKFWAITWNWIIQKKRTGNKPRPWEQNDRRSTVGE